MGSALGTTAVPNSIQVQINSIERKHKQLSDRYDRVVKELVSQTRLMQSQQQRIHELERIVDSYRNKMKKLDIIINLEPG